ncbi:hypothetical protein EQM13_01485 [Acidilutibacter cellobiosedens]|uniref:Uncharacterized protein n=1 Tax=Acidilutibacter cellobiosedens TaxID=2507161 RepID=A0A410Q8R0_9FIRM|nr:hypothetical protein [Acidilutibacter cellobiosedens]QAT60336.1 hypothetical protein EQM13_01485 [Acidilutibacter cellobiosedens]
MEKDFKYPKNIVERLDVFERKFGIEDMNVSVFQDSWYDGDSGVKVIGEILAENLTENILIIITVHNEDGQIIGADFNEKIDAADFGGIYSFSQSLRVASGENIYKVRVYPVKNPASW